MQYPGKPGHCIARVVIKERYNMILRSILFNNVFVMYPRNYCCTTSTWNVPGNIGALRSPAAGVPISAAGK